jgi:hypothetical protein
LRRPRREYSESVPVFGMWVWLWVGLQFVRAVDAHKLKTVHYI